MNENSIGTVRRRMINDEPDNVCFGCSPHNASGLQLEFEELEPGVVRCRYAVREEFAGAPGVIHGGIQATLLDETLGMALQSAVRPVGDEEEIYVVTADFQLRYRRPASTGIPLVVHGRLLKREGRSFQLEGEIVDGEGVVLTRAEARWVRIDPPA